MSKQPLTTDSLRAALTKVKPELITTLIDQAFYELDNKRNKHEWTSDSNCYEWYVAVGRYFKPVKILEIGVRYGYSLMALAIGANAKVLKGYDIEEYEPGSNARAVEAISQRLKGAKVSIELCNSQELTELPEQFDLISIDGDHSYAGTLHDLELTLGKCKVAVIDDYDFLGDVTRAVDHFLTTYKQAIQVALYIPSYRGTYVIVYR